MEETRPRSRFSHTDRPGRLSSVNEMFNIYYGKQEKFNSFNVIDLY